MSKYKLERSSMKPGWWVLTDTENLVVIRFEEHKFNETQKASLLNDSSLANDPDCANKLAHIMCEMGDYMFSHWYSVAMPTPVFEFREDDELDKLFLIRNKHPRFKIEIQDDCNADELRAAICKAAEFIKKKQYEKRK